MRTRVKSQAAVIVDLIDTKTDVAGVSVFSQAFGFDLDMQRDPERSGSIAVLRRRDPVFLSDEIQALVYLQAQAEGVSIEQVLANVKRDLDHAGVDTTEPIPPAIAVSQDDDPEA